MRDNGFSSRAERASGGYGLHPSEVRQVSISFRDSIRSLQAYSALLNQPTVPQYHRLPILLIYLLHVLITTKFINDLLTDYLPLILRIFFVFLVETFLQFYIARVHLYC
jgi:hypothetical protein